MADTSGKGSDDALRKSCATLRQCVACRPFDERDGTVEATRFNPRYGRIISSNVDYASQSS